MSTLRSVNCDNCSASYSIDFEKLKREKNRITCKRCQHKIVVYKSKFLEPQNEQAQVNHADEKTLVEEDAKPLVQGNIGYEPETAVSKDVPPSIPSIGASDFGRSISPLDEEHSDPTIRRASPPPVTSVLKSKESMGGDNPHAQLAKDLDAKPNTSSSKGTEVYNDGLGLRTGLQLCAGLMFLGLVSILSMKFVNQPIVFDLGMVLGASSLGMGLLWLVTSDFGYGKPNLPVSVGGASLIAAGLGAVVFSNVEEQTEKAEKEVKTLVAPAPVEVVEREATEAEEGTEPERPAEKAVERNATAKSMGPSTARVVDVDESRKGHEEMFAAANQYIKSKEEPVEDDFVMAEPSTETRNNAPVVAATDPDEGLGDDLDLSGFDDLGMDDEEEDKKSLFGRKEKEEPKEKPVEPVKPQSSDVKVDIPTSVLDIIIRNNKDVKGCYVQQRAETGSFPQSIDVMFTLQPNGKVSSAYIAEGPYVGSKFEGCIRAAFKKMTFPPFDANAKPQSLKYTLKL